MTVGHGADGIINGGVECGAVHMWLGQCDPEADSDPLFGGGSKSLVANRVVRPSKTRLVISSTHVN